MYNIHMERDPSAHDIAERIVESADTGNFGSDAMLGYIDKLATKIDPARAEELRQLRRAFEVSLIPGGPFAAYSPEHDAISAEINQRLRAVGNFVRELFPDL